MEKWYSLFYKDAEALYKVQKREDASIATLVSYNGMLPNLPPHRVIVCEAESCLNVVPSNDLLQDVAGAGINIPAVTVSDPLFPEVINREMVLDQLV